MLLSIDLFDEEYLRGLFDNFSNWAIKFVSTMLLVIVIWLVGKSLIKWVMKLLNKAFVKSNADKTISSFLMSVIKFTLYTILTMIIIERLGIATSSILALLGSAGLAIGLALQGSLSNFAGGVLILIFKPFKVGDYIKEDANGNEGTVQTIELIYTKLLTPDNKTIVIPNGVLANTSLTNVSTQTHRRIDIRMPIGYSDDIDKAKNIMSSIVNASDLVEHSKNKDVFVASLDDSSVGIEIRFWVKTANYWEAKWTLTEKFKKAFDENGIEIPFNKLDVTILNQ